MKKLRRFLSRIRLVYRRSSILLKCVVLTTIVLCTVTVIAVTAMRIHEDRQKEIARREAAALEQENQTIVDKTAILGTVEGIKQIATEVLGLVDKDTIVFETTESD